jgi:hypothetical protein
MILMETSKKNTDIVTRYLQLRFLWVSAYKSAIPPVYLDFFFFPSRNVLLITLSSRNSVVL